MIQGDIYISAEEDGIVIASILRHATVFASQEQYWKYRNKAKSENPDDDATYVCTMATFLNGQYWFDFDWANAYRKGNTDFDGIKAFIHQKVMERKSTRKKVQRAATKVRQSLNHTNKRMKTMKETTKTKTTR